MKKITGIIVIAFVMLIGGSVFSPAFSQAKKKANKDTENWRYEVECAGIGKEGTYLIKVWSYSKKPQVAMEQSKKNAVHAIIFQGFAGGAQGCTSQKALTNNSALEQEKADFFKEFFADGGKYMKYVSSANDGAIGEGDRVKVGKEYKVGVIVTVFKDNLRKDLEDAGIVKGLNSGF
ncbi:MAG: hypothetical protein IPQ03_02380 [Bacteroidetes bacterium]|nr:hypothetical protein [Bacteroidota bacterium]MBK9543492.1 hypothetical protein [Bacteroidota bacterium]MBL0256417.1 hypothetical protein [Bacteroidota bacterium]MBP6401715.1 hypothetical protein [Bacteroidia bacterium]MBP6648949.1 hypothetical protein [Bacteroidia bacterium]